MSDPKGERREPTLLSSALVDAVAALPVAGRERLLMLAAWPDAVGPEVARNARPASLAGDVLVVEVEHEAWAATLRSFEAAIVERLRSRTGLPVARLETRVRRGAARGGCR